MDVPMTLTTKQKILIIVGAIIFLIADISMIERIVIIAGIVAYFFMRKQLLVDNSIEYTQKIRDTLIIPIVQIIASFFLFEEASGAVKSAGKIDSLHDISTYTPFLGDLGKGLDIANQLGVLPDIERSQSTLEYINSATTVNNVVSFGAILIIILAIAELYGVFRLGKFTKKQMLMLYGGASIAFIVCSIYFGIYMEKFMGVLAGIFSGTDEYPFAIIFPIVTLILVGAFYKAYSNALENLFNCSLPESVKENNLQEQPNRQSEEQIDRNSSEPKVQSEPMQVEETGRIKEKLEAPPQAKIIIKEKAEQKSFFRFNILFGIGLVVLMGIVAWWILQSNEKEYSIQDIETISQQNQNTENYNPEVEGNTGATPQQRNENIEAPSTTNQFEYINEKRGNYEVDIEFPVSLAGMKDVSGIQLAIAQKAFDCNSNDINSCVKKYFKEGAESVSLGEGETAGKVTVKFQQRLNSLYVFKISTYADLGGGTGLSVIYRDEYIYFDKNMNRSLVINDLFNDYSQTLSLVNEHISLDEYASKAKELPENFIISSSGITFIFPKYSIGYGAQGEVEIALTYEELNNVLSDTFKNAIGK